MSTGRWIDLLGTLKTGIKLGLTGVLLKNNTGNLTVRNNADGADAEVTMSKLNVSGNVVVVNSDAAGSGADWLYTLQRPAAGMTAAVILTLPIDDGTPSQVLQTDGSGVLSWTSVGGSTASSEKMDTTSLAFGTASPVAMLTTGAGDIIAKVRVIIDTPFNGTPSLSIGVVGTTSKYMGATEVDLTMAAGTVFEVDPGLVAGGVENIIGTYAAGGASAGAARMLLHYGTPS